MALDVEFEAALFGRPPSAFDERAGLLTRHRAEIHSADALWRRDVDGAGVIVDADVPTDRGGIEFVMAPRGIGLAFVVDRFHFHEEWNHGEVGVDAFVRAG